MSKKKIIWDIDTNVVIVEFGMSNQQSELLLSSVLNLCDLRKRTNVTSRGEAATNSGGPRGWPTRVRAPLTFKKL